MDMLFFILLFIKYGIATGSNIDTDHVSFFSGPSGSRAGYSVTTWLHKKTGQHRVVFGAPENRVLINGENYNIGGIFHCSWNQTDDCQKLESVETILTPESQRIMKLVNESRFNIGLGESLMPSIDQKLLISCAPRFLYRTRYQNLDRSYRYDLTSRGKCFVLEDFEQSLYSVAPLKDDYYKRGRYLYAIRHGQVGLSLSVTRKNELVTGAPSQFHNRGVTQTCNLNTLPKVECRSSQTENSYSYNELIYEGFAVTTGKFNGKTEFIASSAPGIDDNNKIRFYLPRNLRQVYPRQNLVLNDLEFKSFFGYSLAAGDFDGDGSDDLVVSAPWSDVRVSSIFASKNLLIDAGKVFIYYSPMGKASRNPEVTVLDGYELGGNFGHSLFCPGDLDSDGYNDLVVGAPQEGSGTIYIYSGSQNGLRTKPSQTVTALDISSSVHIPSGFGFSIGGGHDVDGNLTPDLVVGAPKRDQIVLLRTAPVINIVGDISLNASGHLFVGKRPCTLVYEGKRTQTSCFELSLSLHFSRFPNLESIPVDVHVKLDAGQQNSRLLFGTSKSSMNMRFFARPSSEKRKWNTYTVYLKPGKHDLSAPVRSTMEIALPPNHILRGLLGPSFNHEILPVLNSLGESEFISNGRLICEDLVGCFPKPNLVLTGIKSLKTVIEEEKSFTIPISLVSLEADGYQIEIKIKAPSQFYVDNVVFSHGEPLQCRISTHEASTHNTNLCTVTQRLPQDRNVTLLFKFSYNAVAVVDSRSKEFEFDFDVSSDNEDADLENNHLTVTVYPEIHSNVHISSISLPENAVIWTNHTKEHERLFFEASKEGNASLLREIASSSEFKHRYTIVNLGPSPISFAEIRMKIPVKLHQSQPPLILLDQKFPPTSGQCGPIDESYLMNSYMDEDNGTQTLENFLDIPGADESSQKLQEISSATNSSQIDFTCSPSPLEVYCLEIKCLRTQIRKNEELHFSIGGFIMAPTVKQMKLKKFSITSIITIKVQGTSVQKKTITSFQATTSQSIYDYLMANIWILALDLFIGIFIMGLMVIFLYKVGFFTRSKKQQLITQKREYRKSLLLRKDSSPSTDLPIFESIFVM